MDANLKENVASTGTWGRALFMILFAIIYSVAEIVLATVVIIQFFFVLFTGTANPRLLGFGQEISQFIYDVFIFLTYNSEERPFPFAPWPSSEIDDDYETDDDIDSYNNDNDADFSDNNERIEGPEDK